MRQGLAVCPSLAVTTDTPPRGLSEFELEKTLPCSVSELKFDIASLLRVLVFSQRSPKGFSFR